AVVRASAEPSRRHRRRTRRPRRVAQRHHRDGRGTRDRPVRCCDVAAEGGRAAAGRHVPRRRRGTRPYRDARCDLPAARAGTDTVRRAKQEAGVPLVLSGLERFVSSAAHLGRWSRWWRESTRYAPRDQQPGGGRPLQVPDGPLSEHDARELLPTAGVPVVPAKLAATANEAVEMAASFDSPVVLKVCSAAIAQDRKSTRLNSSHVKISYAVFCLKKKK